MRHVAALPAVANQIASASEVRSLGHVSLDQMGRIRHVDRDLARPSSRQKCAAPARSRAAVLEAVSYDVDITERLRFDAATEENPAFPVLSSLSVLRPFNGNEKR
jgi:hypothetical protein